MPDLAGWSRRLGVLLACGVLAACATPHRAEPPARTPHHHVTPSREPPSLSQAPPEELAPETLRLTDLQGWEAEDHAAAFAAFQAGCRVTPDPALYATCKRARSVQALEEREARAFFEDNFRLRQVVGQGILTGYFVPEYEARDEPAPPFTAAVRPRPADLPQGSAPYADRAAIEASPPDRALAWMRAEDLFFMQVQGSGVLDFPDGHRLKASFAASNNQPFVAIAVPLRQRGALSASGSSGDSVRAWLADHRGPEADAVMRLDPRYIFFRVSPDDGREPSGTAGVPLTPGRAIAVDPSHHPMGGLYWIAADAPTLSGAAPVYRRLVMALDTGGAIKGPVRADLYIGRGPAAGTEAGHIRHALTLYELMPVAGSQP